MADTPQKKPRPARATKPLKVTLSIGGMPALMAAYRRELAEILRERAADLSPAAAAEVRQVADLFEAGLREEP